MFSVHIIGQLRENPYIWLDGANSSQDFKIWLDGAYKKRQKLGIFVKIWLDGAKSSQEFNIWLDGAYKNKQNG